ncbi:MAG: DUF3467 domain-containing protein [bacterium]
MTEEKWIEKFNVEIEDSAKRGEYTNFVRIQHSPLDFRLDLARVVQEDRAIYVHSRVFMSPQHAKLFLQALQDNVAKYEKQFGAIAVGTERLFEAPSKQKH